MGASHRNSQGFTLIEALVSFVILAIGFTGLYTWFNAYALQSRNDIRVMRSLAILRNQAEWSLAHAHELSDTIWRIHEGNLEFEIRCDVLDSVDLRVWLDERGFTQAPIDPLRPKEVQWTVTVLGRGAPISHEMNLIVGGVHHGLP